MRSLKVLSWALLLLISCKGDKNEPGTGKRPAGPEPVFDAVLATPQQLNRTVEASGTILPNESTELHPEVSGRVVAINFREGSQVQKGTLLVKLFDADLQAQLNKLKVQLEIANATLRRQNELLSISGTSQQDFDNASLTASNIKADMELMQVNIAKTQIRAPFSGRLGLRNISLGAYVTPATAITGIAEVNVLKVEFSVPEKYASEMQPGRKLQLKTDGGSQLYNASVIASQNSISQDSRNLMVRAIVNNPDRQLSPGAFVQVKIAVGNNIPAIMVPSQAIIPSTRFKKVIITNEGKAEFRTVTTGFRDSSRVEILEGIKLGDTVITNGLLSIKDGMLVKVKVGL